MLNDFKPSEATLAIKSKIQSAYTNFQELIIYLCICEKIVILFSPAMRKNLEVLGFNVSRGYYSVHGVSSDLANCGFDDYHEEDLLLILIYCLDTSKDALDPINIFLNNWVYFWKTFK